MSLSWTTPLIQANDLESLVRLAGSLLEKHGDINDERGHNRNGSIAIRRGG